MRDDEFPTHCQDCGCLVPAVSNLVQVVKDLESDGSRLRRQLSVARGERNDQRSLSAFADQAHEVFHQWNLRVRGGKAKEFGGARFDPVVERLTAGADVEEDFFVAIEGARRVIGGEASFKPRDPKGYTDLKNIAKDAPTLDRFKEYAEEPVSNVVELPLPRRGETYDPFHRPLDRALIALRREFGFDAVWKATDRDEWWSVCPLHPSEQTPMRLTERRGAGSSLQAACVNGCLPSLILNAVRGLENKRAQGLVGVPVTQLRARESA